MKKWTRIGRKRERNFFALMSKREHTASDFEKDRREREREKERKKKRGKEREKARVRKRERER